MDCIKPGHRTRQGPGQDGQCQQAAEIDKTKEEAAETHGSTPAAASTTLKVEASNGLPGFRRADLWCYLASQMAEIGLTPFWLFIGSAAIKFHCREAPRDGRSRPTGQESGECRWMLPCASDSPSGQANLGARRRVCAFPARARTARAPSMREPRNRMAQVRRFGGPDGLEVVAVPLPRAGRGASAHPRLLCRGRHRAGALDARRDAVAARLSRADSVATHDPAHGQERPQSLPSPPLVQIVFSAQGTPSFRDARPESRLRYAAARAMPHGRDRWFESCSLQRRVCCEP